MPVALLASPTLSSSARIRTMSASPLRYVCGFSWRWCKLINDQALPNGNDVEMGGGYWSYEIIPELIESGKLDESVLNTAVSRVLRAKFKMGIFENPYPGVPAKKIFDYVNTKKNKQVARQLDTESIVLLENHDNTLPLKKNANVAVIGPMAHGYVNVSAPRYHPNMRLC